eukprot:m.168941 g.168941  ORF g.168941 m.168941 type:complete len:361 (+) comp13028_c0_seq1:487-1569(+)
MCDRPGSPGYGEPKPAHLTLSRYILEEFKGDDAQMSFILNGISVAAKVIANAVQHYGIKPEGGMSGRCSHGENKLDELAADVLLNALNFSQKVGVVVLDKHEKPYEYDSEGGPPRKYAVVSDALDGSTNVGCNISVGTTFGIYRSSSGKQATLEDVLRPGSKMCCAGYVLYGSATVMMLSKGRGVQSFVMDPDYGEFVMTSNDVKIPDPAMQIYSINSGNSEYWDTPTREFIRWTKGQAKPYLARYIGSMVSDVHRTMICGGIFMYPADKRFPSGKLRLLCECAPLAFLVEQAGGMATNGYERILDVSPKDPFDTQAIFLGCRRDVSQVVSYYSYHKSGETGTAPGGTAEDGSASKRIRF